MKVLVREIRIHMSGADVKARALRNVRTASSILSCQKPRRKGAVGCDCDLFSLTDWKKFVLCFHGHQTVSWLDNFKAAVTTSDTRIQRLAKLSNRIVATSHGLDTTGTDLISHRS